MISKIRFSLLFLAVAFLLFQACDDPPGTSPYETSRNLISSLEISPEDIQFEPEMGIKDTTVAVQLQVGVLSPDELSEVNYRVIAGASNTLLRDGQFQPQSDNKLGASFSLNTSTTQFINYRVEVYGRTLDNQVTNTIQGKINILGFLTDPPEVLSFDHPETVQIPSGGNRAARFETMAVHPAGNENIEAVYLELFDSNGIQLGGGPFTMLDDGDTSTGGSGDLEAGDNIYTRRFFVNNQNSPEVYNVFTYAIDRMGVSSDTLFSTFSIVE